MLVSVIIPTYNRAQFLEVAIMSVFSQGRKIDQKFDIELIIIDDGSTDNTQHKVKQIITNYNLDKSKIQYLRFNKNGGIPRALNKGYELAKGDFVCQLSSDDWWDPHKLSKQIEIMNSDENIGIIYSNYIFVELPERHMRTCKVFHSHTPREMYFRLFQDCFMNACTFLMCKAFKDQIGQFPLRPEFEWNQDLWFNFQAIFATNWKIHYQNDVTAYITIHEEQASKQGKCGKGNNILLPEMAAMGKAKGF